MDDNVEQLLYVATDKVADILIAMDPSKAYVELQIKKYLEDNPDIPLESICLDTDEEFDSCDEYEINPREELDF